MPNSSAVFSWEQTLQVKVWDASSLGDPLEGLEGLPRSWHAPSRHAAQWRSLPLLLFCPCVWR